MAVALNPTKTLYSKKATTVEDNDKPGKPDIFNNVTNYADSPSRQLRRSARVASLSPSSFTPLISQHSGTSSSSSSYMPTSPSSKYSMMRGGYNGVSIDEIVINEIEPENRAVSNKKSSLYPTLEPLNLRSNPDRKHPTLNFQPTNLSTPSTTVLNQESGITPAINKVNLHSEATPLLEKLVTKGEMEEIAKATPLGRKATEPEKSKNTEKSGAYIGINGGISNNNNNSSSSNRNGYNISTSQRYNSNNQTHNQISNSSNNNTNNQSATHNNTNNMAKTPQKQTNEQVVDSDETVKVVRTLRNRSIVASPVPGTSSLRRNSLAAAPQQPRTQPKIDVTVFFKKHQKNVLAYSLVSLFLIATLYHIYDGLTSVDINDRVTSVPTVAVPSPIESEIFIQPSPKNDEILKLINEKFTEIQELENEKISNLFEKAQESFNEKLEKLILPPPAVSEVNKAEAELQRKALESVTKSVKNLEKKFEALEAKIEQVKSETVKNELKHENELKQAVKNSEQQSEQSSKPLSQPPAPRVNLMVKVVKHLSTSPIGSGLFKSSDFPPENALTPQPIPFKFSGNRGKLAVLLPHNLQALPSQVTIEHPLLPDRSCAPRDIEIWALSNALNERDNPVLIGKGTFDLSKESQSFKLNQERLTKSVDKPLVLQLRIRNNHGNDKFTCLYNFKVQL